MDKAMIVRATVRGVEPQVYELMEVLGITAEQAKGLKELSVNAVQEALSSGLTIDEIVQLVQNYTIRDDRDLHTRVTLANQLGNEAYTSLKSRDLAMVHEFLEAGFNTDDALALSHKNGIWGVKNAIAARQAGIALSDLAEAWAVHYDSSYVDARIAGATHAELLDVLRRTQSVASDFDLDDYVTVTTKGIATHEQIVAMLQEHGTHKRRYYLEFVLGTEGGPDAVTHEQAMEILATSYYYRSNYWRTRSVASHDEAMEIANTGMGELDYTTLRDNHPRVTHGEIVQLASLDGRASELPTFIRLIDTGYSYDGIKATGMSISNYQHLRVSDYGPHLTQQQVLELKDLPLGVDKYIELRQEGIPHEVIVANAQQ